MKNVIIITYIDFWRKGAGHRSRLESLIKYFQEKVCITVLFIGIKKNGDDDILSNYYNQIGFYFLEPDKQLSQYGYLQLFKLYIKQNYFDVAILEYIELQIAIDYIPESTIKILDTHDLVSDKVKSFNQANLNFEGLSLNFQQELAIFEKFDFIMLINKADFDKVKPNIKLSKSLLVPHPICEKKMHIKTTAKTLGFIGSEYEPNVMAIEWFISEVWPMINNLDIQLNIYGNVTKRIKNAYKELSNINLIGFVSDITDIYNSIDIVINPVHIGAGLKIKNIEALGFGLPLITTLHGSQGINGIPGKHYLIGNSANEFAKLINMVYNDYEMRKSLAVNAFELATSFFSPKVCYIELERVLCYRSY